MFCSDGACDLVEDVIHDYEKLMDALDLGTEIREDIWYNTAARILGLPG